MAGLAGGPVLGAYHAAKHAVVGLSKGLRADLAIKQANVGVTCVCPGAVMTPMQEAEYTQEMRIAFENKLPLRRLGAPEDVAALFAFLASDEAAFITGQHFVIDGGEIAGGLASQA